MACFISVLNRAGPVKKQHLSCEDHQHELPPKLPFSPSSSITPAKSHSLSPPSSRGDFSPPNDHLPDLCYFFLLFFYVLFLYLIPYFTLFSFPISYFYPQKRMLAWEREILSSVRSSFRCKAVIRSHWQIQEKDPGFDLLLCTIVMFFRVSSTSLYNSNVFQGFIFFFA